MECMANIPYHSIAHDFKATCDHCAMSCDFSTTTGLVRPADLDEKIFCIVAKWVTHSLQDGPVILQSFQFHRWEV